MFTKRHLNALHDVLTNILTHTSRYREIHGCGVDDLSMLRYIHQDIGKACSDSNPRFKQSIWDEGIVKEIDRLESGIGKI